MNPLEPTPTPSFRPGDWLSSADLNDWQRRPSFSLARHFRSLHRHYDVRGGWPPGRDRVRARVGRDPLAYHRRPRDGLRRVRTCPGAGTRTYRSSCH